jgi:hypothetical protein
MRSHRSTRVPLAVAASAAVAVLAVPWPSVALAGASRSDPGATTPLGEAAAQVGSRLVLDSLAVPGGPSAAPDATPPGGVTVALASLVAPVIAPPSSPTLVSTPPPAVHTTAPATVVTQAPPTGTSTPAAGVWAELRQCESGGNYATDTGNGYYGAYQFSAATWHGLGYAGLPNQALPAVQDQAAQRLQARSGWGQWPACSRKLGL